MQLKEPPLYKVIFFNDDVTTMDFVVNVLVRIFHKSQGEAEALMLRVHEKGQAVVGLYSYDIAYTRVELVREESGKHGFPLHVELKKE